MRKILFLSLLFIGVILWFSSCNEKAEPDSPLSGIEKAVSEDGVGIYYKIKGVGNYSLVFVHGWCNDMSYWENQIPAFSSGYKVITLDLAGHGISGKEREFWTMEAFGKDVASVIKREGLENIILIGHGMGGAVILEAAGLVPERIIGLVGIDTFKDHYMRKYSREQVEFFLKPWREDFESRMREYAVETFFHNKVDQELMKKVIIDMRESQPEKSLNMLEHLLRYDGSQAFKEIKVPIQCINSKLRDTTYEIATQNAASFDWIYQTGAGHFPMLENPDFFNRLLATILEDIIMDLYKRQEAK
ncbi:MAG: alpha/beta hydrolase [Candidatus Aminicenantes bacterium]